VTSNAIERFMHGGVVAWCRNVLIVTLHAICIR
jgi:hypothetical protein